MVRVSRLVDGSLLAVGCEDEDLFQLRTICSGAGWTLRETQTVKQAMACLKRGPVPVVLCQEKLPDGRWAGLLDGVVRLPEPPLLIVWSRLADCRLWGEVLNLGGFDVLAAPLDEEEVVHVISTALRSWKGDRDPEPGSGDLGGAA